jgi:chemotaxis signal transduction protein
MHDRMNIGQIIDLDRFVDLRFADQACTDRVASLRQSVMHDTANKAMDLMARAGNRDEGSKTLLNKEGKYLSFLLGDQQYGIDILKIREIIRLVPIRPIPKSPPFVRGIIDLRGKVVPVIDLRTVFGMPSIELTGKHCIIVLEIETVGRLLMAGVIVDGVSEVTNIEAKDIEETPSIGMGIDMAYLLGIAKTPKGIEILLDIDRVLDTRQTNVVEQAVESEAA